MTRDELIAELAAIREKERVDPHYDEERAHAEADDALIAFIGDDEVKKAFDAIYKWYA